MKKLIPLIFLLSAGNAVAESYLCLADITTGARVTNGVWRSTQFTSDAKFIIKMNEDVGYFYQHGSEWSAAEPEFLERWSPCQRKKIKTLGKSKYEIECVRAHDSLIFTSSHNRFVYTNFGQYLEGWEKDSISSGALPDNYVALGQCSKL